MDRTYVIPTAEITNFREGLVKIQSELETYHQKRIQFSQDALAFLESYNISLISNFVEDKELSENFMKNTNDIRRRILRVFNKCTSCRLSILLAIYGIMAFCQLSPGILVEVLPSLIQTLRDLLKRQDIEIENHLEFLQKKIEELRPSALANKLCEDLGMCDQISGTTSTIIVPDSGIEIEKTILPDKSVQNDY